ncbi:MAG: DUF1015 family protein [Gammaproteobacteria bacterium]|jgi:uncharacterized protein (DUF1015 family)
MTLFRAFRALRPSQSTAADVIAPPYDVLSAAEARELAAGRPHSFLHVSRPEIDLADGADSYSEAAYGQAAASFRAMRDQNVLQRDAEPSLYIYRMTDGDHVQTGVAVTASVAAYDANRVRRHELTRPDKENDRVRHMEAVNAQTGPVLCACRATESIRALTSAAAAAGDPDVSVIGPNDVLHSIWRVSDDQTLDGLLQALNGLDAIYIADGHHRSAAASRVAAARRDAGIESESHEYFLTVVYPHDEMRIFDYNRVVTDLNGMSAPDFLARLGERFDVAESRSPVRPVRTRQIGMYLDGRWYRLDAKQAPTADPVAALDVSLLHDGLIEPLLGISNPRTDPRVDFVGGIRGLDALVARVDGGGAAVAFALFPTRMDQLMAVADAGRLMPPKSTWFEPKLADGLLSHVLD